MQPTNGGRSPVYQIIFFFLIRLLAISALSFLSTGIAIGQEQRIDSLLRVLHLSKNGQKADVFYELAYEYIVVDVDEARKYSRASLETARQIGDSLKMVKAGRLLTSAYRRLEMLDSAVLAAENALSIALRNDYREETKILFNSLALAYSFKAEYDRALDYHFRSLVARERDGDKKEISITLNNIGFVYFKLKNYEKALEYYQRALELKKEAEDTWDLDRVLINIGLCNIHLKHFGDALRSINEGFSACGTNCSDEIKIEGEFGLGVANYGLEKYSEARDHFNNSLQLAKRIDNKRFQAENLVYLGRVSLKTNEFETAAEYLSEAEAIAMGPGYNQLRIDTYREFSNLYNLSEDFQRASFYQNKYIALKDSVIGEELVKNIAKIQTQFEERQNIATIKDREEVIARQRMLNVSIGIISILSALLVFVLYRSNRVTRRVNRQLSEAKGIIEEKNQQLEAHAGTLQKEVDKATADLQRVNESLKGVNEELDNFIYKTSHDIRGPLASLKGMCNVALIDVRDPLALDYLKKLDMTAAKLNRILTRLLIVNQINNAPIHQDTIHMENLVEEVITMLRKRGIPSNLSIRCDIQSDISFQSDDALLRIILENLLDNAIKFYNDSERANPFVTLKVHTNNSDLQIQVIDNGIGFSGVQPDKVFLMFSRASEKSGTGGLGLYLIKQATSRLGGTIELRFTPEGYTEFFLSIPLELPATLVAQAEM